MRRARSGGGARPRTLGTLSKRAQSPQELSYPVERRRGVDGCHSACREAFCAEKSAGYHMMGEVIGDLGGTTMKRLLAASTIAMLLLITGCASATAETAPSPTKSPSSTPKATKTPKPTPTASATPKPVEARQVGFDCYVELPKPYDWQTAKITTMTFKSPQEVWAYTGVISSCQMKVVKPGPMSTTEKQALATAAYTTESNVYILWEMCARKDHFYATNGPLNAEQQTEANGVLVLCPDHPGAAIMANGSPEQNERNEGLRFGTGVREVNTQIQPGTYRSAGPVENCYWARLDSAGGIIENSFIPAATQVEIYVDPSDFSLHIEGCGEVVKVG